MDELAYSLNGENVHYGTPRNVLAPGRVPGGSSSGSAVAGLHLQMHCLSRVCETLHSAVTKYHGPLGCSSGGPRGLLPGFRHCGVCARTCELLWPVRDEVHMESYPAVRSSPSGTGDLTLCIANSVEVAHKIA